MDSTFDDSPGPSPAMTQRDRRRERPQLSCTFCRRRKIRCDRQLPCKTCVAKNIAVSCTYTPGTKRQRDSVGERIQQLDALVRSLMQNQHTEGVVAEPRTPTESPQSTSIHTQASADEHVGALSSHGNVTSAPSPAPSEQGSLRIHSHGANYVSSFHWAAVLDSISDLRNRYEEEVEERRIQADSNDYVPPYHCTPRLLYEPVEVTKSEILSSIPPRPVVDRMIARYFNAQGIAPVILHSTKFLREYESFWPYPAAISFTWLGLLFSIMCLSTQLLHLGQGYVDSADIMDVHWFRERTVHCLILGHFTRGGPHIMETMINHIASEVFLCKDAEIGLWLLLGIIVQLALSQGYHRDPRNFPNISVFEGEMRRRVWASVVQMDLRISVHMGLPHLLKMQQCDTEEPRNLLDSDFDDTTSMVELPPSRPETEITPILYRLAKNRIDIAGGLISDLLADTKEQPYSEIMNLDQKLQAAEATMPPIFHWQPLNQSFMVAPQVVLHRIWLQLGIQRLIICLHRKYLAPSYAHDRYAYSRNACVQAAIKILQFQQLIDEEIQPGGQLYPVRWMQSSLLQFNFLLGMSVLCYYIQLSKSTSEVQLNEDTKATIYSLLRSTYPLWLRSSAVSEDARKAVEHLSQLLGLHSELESTALHEPADNFAVPQDAPISIDQITWDTYQECIANFPSASDTDFILLNTLGSSSMASVPMTNLRPESPNELENWMKARTN